MLAALASLLQVGLAGSWLALPLLGVPLGRTWALNFTEIIRLQLISFTTALFSCTVITYFILRVAPNWVIMLVALACNITASVVLFLSQLVPLLVLAETLLFVAAFLNFILSVRLHAKHYPGWTIVRRVFVLMLAFAGTFAGLLALFTFVPDLHYVFFGILFVAITVNALFYIAFLRQPFLFVEAQEEEFAPLLNENMNRSCLYERRKRTAKSYWIGFLAVFFSFGALFAQLVVASADHEDFPSRGIAAGAFARGIFSIVLPPVIINNLPLLLLITGTLLVILPHFMNEIFSLVILGCTSLTFSCLLMELVLSAVPLFLCGEPRRAGAYLLTMAISTLIAGFSAAIFATQVATEVIYFSLAGASRIISTLFAYLT